jgi:SAM-dependent methyltransferase
VRHGGEIERLGESDADPQRVYGIDLTFARVLSGTRAGIPHLVCADGARIPFRDGVFDLALMNTVMTSVLSDTVRSAIVLDVLRILRPGGLVAWYDFIWNPRNRETRGVVRKELARLFPGCRIRSERVTLAPPIARAVVPRWPAGAVALNRVPYLRSHLIATIRKPG